MKRIVWTSIAMGILLIGAAAHATVSVTLSASGAFTPGSVITLNTYVTADAGEIDNAVFGALWYTGSQVNGPLDPGPGGTQQQFSLPGAGWILGTLSCTTMRCLVFNQINSTLPQPAPVNVSNFLIGTNTFTIEPDELFGSVIAFTWQSSPSTQRLDFFGVTNAPGVSITVVPEPTTVALLGLGLCAIAVAGRRKA